VDVVIFVILAWVIHHHEGLKYPFMTALSLILFISLLAALVSSDAAGNASWMSASNRLIFVGVTTAACAAIWIWPNRLLIHQLVRS
jgi:hypothetical protein